MRLRNFLPAAVLLIAALPAMAHPGHGEHGFNAGFMHPINGLDHLVAAIAVGVLATRIGGRAVWLLPATFLTGMGVGGVLGHLAVPLPGVEWGILLSILAIGFAIVLKNAGPLAVTAVATACFAVFHGHAHLAEYEWATGVAGYVVGLVLATAALHAAGVGVALGVKQSGKAQLVRALGVLVIAFGVLKLAGMA